jgi:hypothetical protein
MECSKHRPPRVFPMTVLETMREPENNSRAQNFARSSS